MTEPMSDLPARLRGLPPRLVRPLAVLASHFGKDVPAEALLDVIDWRDDRCEDLDARPRLTADAHAEVLAEALRRVLAPHVWIERVLVLDDHGARLVVRLTNAPDALLAWAGVPVQARAQFQARAQPRPAWTYEPTATARFVRIGPRAYPLQLSSIGAGVRNHLWARLFEVTAPDARAIFERL